MPRRVKLPGASELFRPTDQPATPAPERSASARSASARPGGDDRVGDDSTPVTPAATGRVRHDEKFTVYVTTDELMALEQARLTLRQQGIVADRGKIVRTSIAMALAGLAADAENSELVRHLAGE